MNRLAVSFAINPDIPPSPSPVLIAVVVPFFVLLLIVGVGLFIWRRKKRQAILLSTSSSSGFNSSFGSTSDEWNHARDSTIAGLGRHAASMGSGGTAAPVMKEHRNVPVGTLTPGRPARLSLRSPSPASSHLSLPPDLSPRLVKIGQYPDPGTYTPFANPSESSSEGHSSFQHGRSSAYHYEASTETIDPLPASTETFNPHSASLVRPASPTTEQTYHTAFHEERGTMSRNQRLSEYGSIQTPRKSGILRMSIL